MAKRKTWLRHMAAGLLCLLLLLPASLALAAEGQASLVKVYLKIDETAEGFTRPASVVYDAAAHGSPGTIRLVREDDGSVVDDASYSVRYEGTGSTNYSSSSQPRNAGSYRTVIKLTTSLYYLRGGEISYPFEIKTRELTVTADSFEVLVEKRKPKLSYVIAGFAPGEAESRVIKKAPKLRCDVNMKKVGKYPIIPEDCEATENYHIRYVQGVLVVAMPTYKLGLSPQGTHVFPSATRGYGPVAPVTARFTNNGTGDITGISVSLTGGQAACFVVGGQPGLSILYPEESFEFTVAPVEGLSAGRYSATVTVNGYDKASASFGVSFEVGAPYPDGANDFGIGGGIAAPGGPGSGGDGSGTGDGTGSSGAAGTGAGSDDGGLSGGGTAGGAGSGGQGTGNGTGATGGAGTAGGGEAGGGTTGLTTGGEGGAAAGGSGGLAVQPPSAGESGDLPLTPVELMMDPPQPAEGEAFSVLAEENSISADPAFFDLQYDEESGSYTIRAIAAGEATLYYIDEEGNTFPISIVVREGSAPTPSAIAGQVFGTLLRGAGLLLCIAVPIIVIIVVLRRRPRDDMDAYYS